jgi:hypothetical protein
MGQSARLDVQLSGAANIHATRGAAKALTARLSGAGGVPSTSWAAHMDAHVSGVGQIKVAADGQHRRARLGVRAWAAWSSAASPPAWTPRCSGMGHSPGPPGDRQRDQVRFRHRHVTIGD